LNIGEKGIKTGKGRGGGEEKNQWETGSKRNCGHFEKKLLQD
jgi:hypothetical protein